MDKLPEMEVIEFEFLASLVTMVNVTVTVSWTVDHFQYISTTWIVVVMNKLRSLLLDMAADFLIWGKINALYNIITVINSTDDLYISDVHFNPLGRFSVSLLILAFLYH